MEPSNAASLNTTQHGDNTAYSDFLGGMHTFATGPDQPAGNDDIQEYFHPDLFDTQDVTSNTPQPQQQQAQNFQSAFNQHAPRQSQSPALPAYTPNQHAFTQHPQYNQPVFDPRTMYHSQQTFDPRFYQHQPSHSPAPLEHYPFQNTNFASQNYHPQGMNIQPRQPATPTPTYPHNQQGYSPFINFDSRNSPHMQTQVSAGDGICLNSLLTTLESAYDAAQCLSRAKSDTVSELRRSVLAQC
jgi:hypothetical protein